MKIQDRLEKAFGAVYLFNHSYWLFEYKGVNYIKHHSLVSSYIASGNKLYQDDFVKNAIKVDEVILPDGCLTFDDLCSKMNGNGYSHYDTEYFSKPLSLQKPTYIAENADSLEEVETFLSMLHKTFKYLISKDVLEDLTERYNGQEFAKALDLDNYNDIQDFYKRVVDVEINDYARSIIGNFMMSACHGDTSVFYSTWLDETFNHFK